MARLTHGAQPQGDARLAAALTHALETVPYYAALRTELAGCDAPPLSAFPLLSKRAYTGALEQLMSTAFSDYRRTEDPAQARGGPVLVGEFTSGSSGYPLRAYKTARERTQLALSLLRKRKAIDPAFVSSDLFGFIHNPDYPATSYADGLGNLDDGNIRRVLEQLRDRLRPRALHGNPMLLTYYADYIGRAGFERGPWSIAFIEAVSEPLAPDQREHIAAQFGARVVDCYGCLECYNLAYECPRGRMHVNENVVLELVDPQTGRATAPGEVGEVVLTSLVNRAQPFIRYKTGDLARLAPSTCDCGNPHDELVLTGRRKIDYLKLLYAHEGEGLTICGYDFFHAVMHALAREGLDCVTWFNVVQTELDRFEVQYLPKAEFRREFTRRFAELARRELGQPAHFEFVEKPEREVLHINRKSRVFRSLLQAD